MEIVVSKNSDSRLKYPSNTILELLNSVDVCFIYNLNVFLCT